MNERIKELAKDAEFAYKQEDILLSLVLEKFAELIVRECASLNFSDIDYVSIEGADEISRIIKEHFGITAHVD